MFYRMNVVNMFVVYFLLTNKTQKRSDSEQNKHQAEKGFSPGAEVSLRGFDTHMWGRDVAFTPA